MYSVCPHDSELSSINLLMLTYVQTNNFLFGKLSLLLLLLL